MKPVTSLRLARVHPAGSVELDHDRLVIRLPDPCFLRLVARSILIAAAVLSFPWIRAVIPDCASAIPDPITPVTAAAEDGAALLMLLGDLRRNGLILTGDKAVALGAPRSVLPFLKRSHVDPITEQCKSAVADRAIDFLLVASTTADPDFSFTERVLKVGGIVAVALGSDHCLMPSNYRIAYIRRFGPTFVAMKKIAHAVANAADSPSAQTGRRLLTAPAIKEMLPDRLESQVFLEASTHTGRQLNPASVAKKLAPGRLDLQLFVEVGAHMGRQLVVTSVAKKLAAGGLDLQVIVETGTRMGGRFPAAPAIKKSVRGELLVFVEVQLSGNAKSMITWLNEEEYVVVMNELFLECKRVSMSTKVYRECLALYGKLSSLWG